MNWMVTRNLQQRLDLEAIQQVIESQIENNLKNGKEYVGLIETHVKI